jgi:hypothetical protein
MATKLKIEKSGDEILIVKWEMLMDGRRTKSDGNSSHGLKAR